MFDPQFDKDKDQWVLQVSGDRVRLKEDGSYEITLPLYLTRTYLGPGGAILRPIRQRYRDWLLAKQNGKCGVCGEETPEKLGRWTLDHQPPMNQPGAKFIDYQQETDNRVIHQGCDKAQLPKEGIG